MSHSCPLTSNHYTLLKAPLRCLGHRRYISSNIGMQFKERGEWRHGNEYSTQTLKKCTLFSGQYLCNRSTLDIGVSGYIGIVWPKEHSPEVWSVPPVTPCIYIGVCGGAVGWGTALQVESSRVRFPMLSLEFFIDIILPVALWPWGRLSL